MPAETHHRLRSAHLGNERSIWIRPSSNGTAPRHLAIFLDADFYRDRVGAASVLDALDIDVEIGPTLVVFISAGSMDERRLECPCHPPFARFIAEEFFPWLTALHPEVSVCTGRVLIGLSYTGLAAAYVALSYPGICTHVVTQSGSFWWHDCWLVAQFLRLRSPLPTAFYVDVGAEETAENVQHHDVLQVVSQIDAVRRFRDALLATDHTVSYLEFPRGHDFAAWRETLPAALRWTLA